MTIDFKNATGRAAAMALTLTLALATCLVTPALANDAFAAKEKAIVEASTNTLNMLVEKRGGGELNPDTALQIINAEIAPQFDFPLLAQQALGKNWRNANDAQRNQVSELFGNLLKKTYAVSLSKFTDQSFRHEAGNVRGNKGTVTFIIVNKGKDVAIEYLLVENDGEWKISDVRIEKVSLLGNYRRQFTSIVRKDGVDGLINLLKQKV